jgi:damage-control phosphatase, subfamily I
MRQTLQAARFVGADEDTQRRALLHTMQILADSPADATPPQMSESIHRAIREETHCTDNYLDVKRTSTEQAMAFYPMLKQIVDSADNPFATAARIAVIGNIIDFGVTNTLNLDEDIEKDLADSLTVDHTARLQSALEKAPWVLYLADNAGETVFDRVFIETINHKDVRYVVKSGPVLNEALREDAEAVGLDKIVTISETGVDAVGVVPHRSSQDFLDLLNTAPVIIAKGQANYESLGGTDYNVFFLFKVKCDMVSQVTGLPIGSKLVYNEHI